MDYLSNSLLALILIAEIIHLIIKIKSLNTRDALLRQIGENIRTLQTIAQSSHQELRSLVSDLSVQVEERVRIQTERLIEQHAAVIDAIKTHSAIVMDGDAKIIATLNEVTRLD